MMANKIKVLVTGASGLVGSHLIYALIRNNYEVRALYREGSQNDNCNELATFYSMPSASQQVEWVRGDITDYYSIIDALEGVTYVFHCAAMVSFDPRDKKKLIKVNVDGTTNLVNACLEMKIAKLCYVSSIGTLGKPVDGQFIDEETVWQNDDNHSAYSWSKFKAEMEVWRATKEGLNVVVVNPGVIIGPGNVTRSSGALLGKAQKGIKFYTLGVTGFVDVRDVTKAMVQLTESEINGERFVMVSENLSYQTLFTNLSVAMGMKPPLIYATRILTGFAWRFDSILRRLFGKRASFTRENARTSHSKSYYSSQKIITHTGFSFMPIQQAIDDTVTWMRRKDE